MRGAGWRSLGGRRGRAPSPQRLLLLLRLLLPRLRRRSGGAASITAPAGRKAHGRLSSKDLYALKGGATGEQATSIVKAKAECDSKKRAVEEEAQTAHKKRKLEAHVAAILLADATVAKLEGEAPWTAVLLGKMGVKELTALIVRKGARPNGNKADLVAQVSALWAA